MIILRIRARNVADVVGAGFNTIRVYSGPQAGPWNTLVGTAVLNANTEYYEITDPNGDDSTYYVLTYYTAGPPIAETPQGSPIKGTPIQGVMGVLTVGYVWAYTEIPAIQNAPASTVGQYIIRAEALMNLYGSRYGGWLTSAAQWATNMPIALRMLLEDIWLSSRPEVRQRLVSGFTSERRGSYAYTAAKPQPRSWRDFFTDEIEMLVRPLLAGMRYKVEYTTTQVFPELTPTSTPLTPNQDPNQMVKLWNDYLDVDFLPWPMGEQLLLGPGQLPVGAIHRWSD